MSHWYDSTPEKSRRKRDSNPGPSALEADALTTRPTRRSLFRETDSFIRGPLLSVGPTPLRTLCKGIVVVYSLVGRTLCKGIVIVYLLVFRTLCKGIVIVYLLVGRILCKGIVIVYSLVGRTPCKGIVIVYLWVGRTLCKGIVIVYLLVGCLTSQQHASVSQGRICTDNFTCCHTEIEVADPTFYLTQSQYTDTGPTSPSTDPITPGAWQGSHWSANF